MAKKRNLYNLPSVLTLTLIVLCLAAVVNANAGDVLRLPSKKSGFDSLYKITIKKGMPCEQCCKLIFPETFGLGNEHELHFLKEIVNNGFKIEHDVDCIMPISQDALDHIKFLAIEKQDKKAAKILLYPPGHGGFDLGGGELAEIYGDEYVRPIVEKYKKLGELLDEKVNIYVADQLCYAWINPVIDSNMDLAKLVLDLKKRNITALASRIESTCKKLESKFK
jgi:hypothetical protein